MAVIETFHGLLNHAAKKGVSEVPINSSKPANLRLSVFLDSVEMKLEGIFHGCACIVGLAVFGVLRV
jgi:hypothetical protein